MDNSKINFSYNNNWSWGTASYTELIIDDIL